VVHVNTFWFCRWIGNNEPVDDARRERESVGGEDGEQRYDRWFSNHFNRRGFRCIGSINRW